MIRTELRVIYGDTDQMGVVYYGNYLRFLEAGRNEYIRAHGLTYREFEEGFGLRLPVAEVSVSYKAPARYDDVVEVETSLDEVRRASVRFVYRVLRGGTLLATGHTVHACTDLDGRVRRLPPELLARLDGGAAMEGTGGGP